INQDGFQLEQSDYDALNNLVDQNLQTIDGITFKETYQNGVGTQVDETDANGKTRSLSVADLGQSLGSTIGSLLGGNSLEGRIAASTVVGLIGKEFGYALQQSGFGFETNVAVAEG